VRAATTLRPWWRTTPPGPSRRHAAAVRDALPAEVRDLVEEGVETAGELEVLHADHVDSAFDHYVHTLATRAGRYSLHFADVAPEAPTGSRISVRGVRIGTPSRSPAPPTCSSTRPPSSRTRIGPQKTLAILVNFQNAPSASPTRSRRSRT
jgi:hypothetical protein